MLLARINNLVCAYITILPLFLEDGESQWPPSWLQGAWKVESMQVLLNGEKPNFGVVRADYLVFIDEFKWSISANGEPVCLRFLAKAETRGRLHVLFERPWNLGMAKYRALFSRDGESVKMVSSTRMANGSGRLEVSYSLRQVDPKEIRKLAGQAIKSKTKYVSEASRNSLSKWIFQSPN